jgi:CheY-like chemotaxis protein
MFERFQAGSNGRGSAGLGLAIVNEFVQLHGGTIEARSEGPGRGSTFQMTLPRTNAAPVVERVSAAPPPTRARRILVVDDNRDARELLRTLLELDGHQVQDAADGAKAVRLAVQWTPEIALIDIGLPEVDGYEVARRIRKRLGDSVRLVALTGYSDAEARRLAAEAGFDEHIVKPVDPERLSELLRTA